MTLRQTFEQRLYEVAQLCTDPKKLGHYHELIEKRKLKRMGKENKAK